MVRRWVVDAGASGEVSREEMREAFMDAEAVIARMGGSLSVVVLREPTGTPDERVTVRAIFEWKNHPKAKPGPEEEELVVLTQDELEQVLASAPGGLDVDAGDDDEGAILELPDDAQPLATFSRVPEDPEEAALAAAPEVDETSVPEEHRG